jgi:nitrogen PTS system EIIA component
MTMDLGDLLARDGIIPALKADDKKQLLQELANRAGRITGLAERDIFNALLQRERLGSTGLGRGLAIPHIKMSGVKSITCLFARMEKPVPFESNDGEPVDLVFFLLAPEHAGGDHLKALARISRLVRDPGAVDLLHAAKDADGLRRVLTSPAKSHAA